MIKKIMLIFVLVLLVGCAEVEEVDLGELSNGEEVEGVESTGVVHEVVIEKGLFSPATIKVGLGDTVHWVNADSVVHTVTFENAMMDEELEVGEEADLFVNAVGELRYFCKYHSGMGGKVVVN